ncbi:hypothetical protein HKX48_008702 [Thoreauomyces humboldtii]|nr:hypothetical protein HKX48_008702 [Thoreauomyces humboldtii]
MRSMWKTPKLFGKVARPQQDDTPVPETVELDTLGNALDTEQITEAPTTSNSIPNPNPTSTTTTFLESFEELRKENRELRGMLSTAIQVIHGLQRSLDASLGVGSPVVNRDADASERLPFRRQMFSGRPESRAARNGDPIFARGQAGRGGSEDGEL